MVKVEFEKVGPSRQSVYRRSKGLKPMAAFLQIVGRGLLTTKLEKPESARFG